MKSNAFIFLAAVLSVGGIARADQNYIQALVGDAVVTRGQVLQISARNEDFILDQSRGNLSVAQSNMLALRESIFKSLVNRQLVLQEFKNLEKKGVKIPESVIDGMVNRLIQDKYGNDRILFAKDLQKEGKTLEQFRNDQREDLIYRELVRQSVPDPIISPQQIEVYYRERTNEYTVPERVKIRLIFLKKPDNDTNGATRARAEEICSILKKDGASFSEVAKTYSEAPPAARDQVPDWVETTTQKQPIQDALSKIKPGETSDVIDTPEGCFIALLEDRNPGHMRGLNDPQESPRAEIERKLKGLEQQRRVEAWIKRLESRIFMKQF